MWIGKEQIEADGRASEWEAPEGFSTDVRVLPGHTIMARRDSDGRTRNYGVHDMELMLVLKGPDGAISWKFDTGLWPKLAVKNRLEDGKAIGEWGQRPCSSAGVSFHWPTQVEEYERPAKCDILGGTCYGDTGYSIGEHLVEHLLKRGHRDVFEQLHRMYGELTRARAAVDSDNDTRRSED